MEHSDPDKNYKEYKERFKNMSDKELIEAFNREVGNSGWTSSRASCLAALHEEFGNRYDYSYIGNKNRLSFSKKIKLIGKRILINEPSIPGGLYKCEKCGEYRGEVMKKDLNWDGSFHKAEAEKSEEYLGVSCLCDGILCGKCKKNNIHRPISNTYYADTNRIEHYPYFSGMMGCGECRENKNEPPSEISSQNQQEEGEWEILAKLPQDADELAERFNKESEEEGTLLEESKDDSIHVVFQQKAHQPSKKEQSSSPKRLLLPFSLTAEEALAAVKAHLQIGKQGKPVKFIQIVGYPRPPQAPSSNKAPKKTR